MSERVDHATAIELGTVLTENWGELGRLWLRFSELMHHVLILGRTGSGKTSMALLNICAQILAVMDLLIRRPELRTWQLPGVAQCVIDMKGSPLLLHGLRSLCAFYGIPFYLVSLSPRCPTRALNIWSMDFIKQMSPTAIAELLISAIGAADSRSAESRFFMGENLKPLIELVQMLEPKSFRAFLPYLDAASRARVRNGLSKFPPLRYTEKEIEHSRHLWSALSQFVQPERAFLDVTGSWPPGIPSDVPDNQVDLGDMFIPGRGEGVYFFLLSPGTSPLFAETAANLILQCIRSIATQNAESGKPTNKVIFSVDEGQNAGEQSFVQWVEQMRSAGASVISNFHTLAQLTPASREVLIANTATKLLLGNISRVDLDFMQHIGGDQVEYQRSYSMSENNLGMVTFTESVTEQVVERLRTNDLLKAMATRGISFAHFQNREATNADYAGFGNLIRMQHIFEYEASMNFERMPLAVPAAKEMFIPDDYKDAIRRQSESSRPNRGNSSSEPVTAEELHRRHRQRR